MKQVKRYNFFWISLKKRWNLQQNLQQFTVYWPLAEKPRASVYFKGVQAHCVTRHALASVTAWVPLV